MNDRDLEVLTTTGDSVSGTLIKGLLEARGIPAMLRAYGPAGWLFPGTPGSFGAMDVLVPADRLDEARRLLTEAESEAANADPGREAGRGSSAGDGEQPDAGEAASHGD